MRFRFCFGQRRQKHRGQDRDDRDHDQQFNQGESAAQTRAWIIHAHNKYGDLTPLTDNLPACQSGFCDNRRNSLLRSFSFPPALTREYRRPLK
jgi:hypothetical protein